MIAPERCEGVNEEEGVHGSNERGDDEHEHHLGAIDRQPARNPFKTGFVGEDVDDFGTIQWIDGDEIEDHEHHVDVNGEDEKGAEERGHVEPAG